MSRIFSNDFVLCCDWGTSSFRLRLVDIQNYHILGVLHSSNGVASIFKAWKEQNEKSRFDFYSIFLKESISELATSLKLNLDNTPLFVSGMASSSLGMEELPYADLPFDTLGKNASIKIFEDFNGNSPMLLASGVKSAEDVMRGEETQLIGIIKLNKLQNNKNQAFAFPGTHSKHIFVKNGIVYDFQTFMTGEIFKILKENSILKDSINTENLTELSKKSDIEAFLSGVKKSSKSSILHNLFTVRTNQLFNVFSKNENLFFLSGLLIGDELRELKKKTFDNLTVCCGLNLFQYYKLACDEIFNDLSINFVEPEIMDKATIVGQIQLFKSTLNLLNE